MTVWKNIVGTKYVPNGLQTMAIWARTEIVGKNRNSGSAVNPPPIALVVSGLLARFRDIDFNRYRHCVDPNTPIEAIRNRARQHQSRGVKVGDNSTARTLSFGKEIEEHTMQQGSARVNNGIQQDIGELTAHSCPLERQGNQAWNVEGNAERLATVTGNWAPNSLPKGPQTRGIRGNNDSVGGNRGQHLKNASRI
ncbi:hypothetical protein R3P38DRAFT_2765056 [Favolaschia claudopus]|uniref:Uncharacterized protein n=1 Tax=Favolaschia claudopus TaxID=2862362 RepID=A0AAW0D4B6_9AGAR